jgi:putative protease
MVDHIPDLVNAGIDSLKVEGRMKTALYVATVARTYRKAIDDYFESEEKYHSNMDWYKDEIKSCTYRQFTTGFYFGKPSEEAQIYDNNTYVNEYTYLGIAGGITDDGLVQLEQRNKFSVGEKIEIMKPDGTDIPTIVVSMKNADGEYVNSCPHPEEKIWVEADVVPEPGDIIRRMS